jgi:hypothetical protein
MLGGSRSSARRRSVDKKHRTAPVGRLAPRRGRPQIKACFLHVCVRAALAALKQDAPVSEALAGE